MTQSILVVDDDAATLTLIGMMLEHRGFGVLKAQDGPRALKILVQTMPDLVLLDVMMPNMDGYEVCRQIKANPYWAHLPVVMLSAMSQPVSQIEGFRAGALDYITKPIAPQDLVKRIQSALDQSARPAKTDGAKVIAVSGTRGGVGATTLAVNLATLMAASASTLLIDFELRATAAIHLGLASSVGLADRLEQDPVNITRVNIESALTVHPRSALRLLTVADSQIEPIRSTTILHQTLSMCDVCVIDLGWGFDPARRAMMQAADACILVLDSEQESLLQSNRMLQALGAAGLPPEAIKLVCINRLGTPAEILHASLRGALDHDLTVTIGPASEALYEALDQGQPIVLSNPDHPVAVQIRALADSLFELSPHHLEFA